MMYFVEFHYLLNMVMKITSGSIDFLRSYFLRLNRLGLWQKLCSVDVVIPTITSSFIPSN